jgi:hypothetical protein
MATGASNPRQLLRYAHMCSNLRSATANMLKIRMASSGVLRAVYDPDAHRCLFGHGASNIYQNGVKVSDKELAEVSL